MTKKNDTNNKSESNNYLEKLFSKKKTTLEEYKNKLIENAQESMRKTQEMIDKFEAEEKPATKEVSGTEKRKKAVEDRKKENDLKQFRMQKGASNFVKSISQTIENSHKLKENVSKFVQNKKSSQNSNAESTKSLDSRSSFLYDKFPADLGKALKKRVLDLHYNELLNEATKNPKKFAQSKTDESIKIVINELYLKNKDNNSISPADKKTKYEYAKKIADEKARQITKDPKFFKDGNKSNFFSNLFASKDRTNNKEIDTIRNEIAKSILEGKDWEKEIGIPTVSKPISIKEMLKERKKNTKMLQNIHNGYSNTKEESEALDIAINKEKDRFKKIDATNEKFGNFFVAYADKSSKETKTYVDTEMNKLLKEINKSGFKDNSNENTFLPRSNKLNVKDNDRGK